MARMRSRGASVETLALKRFKRLLKKYRGTALFEGFIDGTSVGPPGL